MNQKPTPIYQHRISDIITPWVDQALVEICNGEKIVWEGAIMPNPQDGSASFGLLFWLPGAVLGSNVQGSCLLSDPLSLDREGVKEVVVEMIRQLREARSQQVDGANPANPGAQPRGQRPSGLLIPG